MMKYIRQFIESIFNAIWPIMLSNPLTFLGVTGAVVFIIINPDNEYPSTIEEGIGLFIIYIIMLCTFMDKRPENSPIREKQNNVVNNNFNVFSIFKIKR